ncbi:MAG: HAD-IC family P-type ATPase, partial [Xanthomonadales bacterium]|nr:HAD-IC family P-type ATPase [Xanthomonadales bacterium]
AIVLIIATLTAIYYSIYAPDETMLIVLSVLVATCPCALSLATPVALTAASVKLMKQGILSRNLDAITKISKIKNWFFDKTGTLTEPTMSLVKVHNFSDKSDTEILELTAALEHESSHPIASAFNDYYNPKIQVADFENKSGQGVIAKIDGIQYKAGNKEWCGKNNHQILTQNTLVYLYENDQPIAAFELDNQLRHDSKNQIKYLQSRGYQLAIVSGDKQESVAKTASNLDISQFYAEQTPEQKINLIHACQQQSQSTVMVGDGINDAPVLAKADVSISFNQGTQLARAASDMIIMGSSLSSIKSLILTGNKTNKIIHQNIIWALFYNLSVTPLAIMGYLAPWMAAIGMSISSLVVALNAKRLLLGSK